MDPITHTLVGAALAESGLKRLTPLGTATLLIGANLPDVDIAAYAWGEPIALAFRRGWTHGVLAIVVLPFVLTGTMLLWDRYVRRVRAPSAPPVLPSQLLILSAVAIATHAILDYLNVYGMRWLMPFSDRWFYGDVLFIVDPWVWGILAGGVWLATRRWKRGAVPSFHRSTYPARIALIAVTCYILLMAASAAGARWFVWRALPFSRAGVGRIMVAPAPIDPFRKYVVLDEGDAYRVGEFNWLDDPRIRYGDLVVVSRRGEHANAVRRSEAGRRFLAWARFPFFEVEPGTGGRRVHIIDARYTLESSAPFGALSVEVEPQ